MLFFSPCHSGLTIGVDSRVRASFPPLLFFPFLFFFLFLAILFRLEDGIGRDNWITVQRLAKETAAITKMDLMTLFYLWEVSETPRKLDPESEMAKRPEVGWCNNEGA